MAGTGSIFRTGSVMWSKTTEKSVLKVLMNSKCIYKACATIRIYGRHWNCFNVFVLFGEAHSSVPWKPFIGCDAIERSSFRSRLGGRKQSPESVLNKIHREMYMWARRITINVTDIISGQPLGD